MLKEVFILFHVTCADKSLFSIKHSGCLCVLQGALEYVRLTSSTSALQTQCPHAVAGQLASLSCDPNKASSVVFPF